MHFKSYYKICQSYNIISHILIYKIIIKTSAAHICYYPHYTPSRNGMTPLSVSYDTNVSYDIHVPSNGIPFTETFPQGKTFLLVCLCSVSLRQQLQSLTYVTSPSQKDGRIGLPVSITKPNEARTCCFLADSKAWCLGFMALCRGPLGASWVLRQELRAKSHFFRWLIIIRLGHGGAEFWILIISERHHRLVSWFFQELSNALLELSKCSKEGLETRRFE